MGDHEIELHGKLALPEWSGIGASLEARYRQTWSRRREEVLQTAEKASGLSRAELGERLGSDERYLDAFLLVGDRAAQSADADYRSALARLLAGALDDARIDEVSFMITQVVKLEPLHLRVLFAACIFWSNEEQGESKVTPRRLSPDEAALFTPSRLNSGQIADQLGLPLELVDIAVASLSTAGFLNGAAALTYWGIRAVETMFPNLSYAEVGPEGHA